jgi:hypothetical protein
MSEKIQETQQRLKSCGYFASEELSKKILLFEKAGEKSKESIPALLLQGPSGAGKTCLGKSFAKMIGTDELFLQCFPRMGTENFHCDVNIRGVMKHDADNSIKDGILLQALEQSKRGPVVLVIDELDKARPENDSFLLDFLENGRLTTGTDTYERGDFPIYTFITSNDKREIDDALLNRCRRVVVPRPEKELFLEILGLPEEHYIGYIYDKCPDFSIRQARQYLEDLKTLEVEFDEDALSQYINLDDLEVRSVADLQRISNIENGTLEIEIPDLKGCRLYNEKELAKILADHKDKFKLHCDDDKEDKKLYISIDTLEQLKIANKYIDYNIFGNGYEGWFEYTPSNEEMELDKYIWASNKGKKYGTRLGIKVEENNIFKVAENRGISFVYLDSSDNTLEKFLGISKDESVQAYDEIEDGIIRGEEI